MRKTTKKSIIAVSVIIFFILLIGVGFDFLRRSPVVEPPTITTPPLSEHKVFEMVVKGGIIRFLSTGDDEFSLPGHLRANVGDVVTIKITVDEDNDFLIHGYNAAVETRKNEQAELTITMDKPGLFKLELVHTNTDLGVIEVVDPNL